MNELKIVRGDSWALPVLVKNADWTPMSLDWKTLTLAIHDDALNTWINDDKAELVITALNDTVNVGQCTFVLSTNQTTSLKWMYYSWLVRLHAGQSRTTYSRIKILVTSI